MVVTTALPLPAESRARVLLASLVVLLLTPATGGVRGVTWNAPAHAVGAVERGLQSTLDGTVGVIVRALPGRERDAETAVRSAGGAVETELPMIDGFSARVPADALPSVARAPGVHSISGNHTVQFEEISYDSAATASNFVRTAGVAPAWSQGTLGDGVGVAVIDTGVSDMNDLNGRIVHGPDLSGEGTVIDSYGHGTVMAGIIAGGANDSAGSYPGVAPHAHVVAVKAAGRNGTTDVSTVLQAMHFVSAYKDQFNIRVLNLSWGTPSTQDPAVDPLNYAVERLWRQGIVVVVAAGNSGPSAGTVMKPGDDPVIVTAGAFNDGQNTDRSDDNVPSWSSRGPTAQGVAKPDVVAPGRLLIASRSYGSSIEQSNPKALVSPSYIRGSGTSQAAAVTSGVAALLLQARPDLTPDQVKAILKGTASPMGAGPSAEQGAGRVNLGAALSAAAGPTSWQTFSGSGLGSIEASRAGRHVQTDCGNDGTVDVIQGEIDVRCEAWNGSTWTGSTCTGDAWTGSTWTGSTWTGSTWTGSTWTGGTWTGGSWQGSTWTGSTWTGSTWTGSTWTGSTWTGSTWTGSTWTGSTWTTSYDHFLTAFWGLRPKAGMRVAGEVAEDQVPVLSHGSLSGALG